MNKVYELEYFSKAIESIEKDEKEWIEKIRCQLQNNLFIGKPLRFQWLREKRYHNKRLFFIINPKTNKALLISFCDKKGQQETIEQLIRTRETYFKLIT
ncbi:hypothetical protein ACFL1B_02780 [Nanoarchaeota archaeon]